MAKTHRTYEEAMAIARERMKRLKAEERLPTHVAIVHMVTDASPKTFHMCTMWLVDTTNEDSVSVPGFGQPIAYRGVGPATKGDDDVHVACETPLAKTTPASARWSVEEEEYFSEGDSPL